MEDAHPKASISLEMQEGYSTTPQTMTNNHREVDHSLTVRARDEDREVRRRMEEHQMTIKGIRAYYTDNRTVTGNFESN